MCYRFIDFVYYLLKKNRHRILHGSSLLYHNFCDLGVLSQFNCILCNIAMKTLPGLWSTLRLELGKHPLLSSLRTLTNSVLWSVGLQAPGACLLSTRGGPSSRDHTHKVSQVGHLVLQIQQNRIGTPGRQILQYYVKTIYSYMHPITFIVFSVRDKHRSCPYSRWR